MKKRGFTIAELLVTMAIVGVVAALTMPTLVSSYNKKVWAKSLAPAISDFETAMQTMLVRENVDTLFETKAWSECSEELDGNVDTKYIKSFVVNISNFLKIKEYSIKALNIYDNISNLSGSDANEDIYDSIVLKTPKSINYIFEIDSSSGSNSDKLTEKEALNQSTNLQNIAAIVFIDVNGIKKPNILGKDIYGFVLGQDGKLYPYGSKDYSRYKYNNDTWHWTKKCKDGALGTGEYCTARVIENGFVIDY